jgi:hypothetical protein
MSKGKGKQVSAVALATALVYAYLSFAQEAHRLPPEPLRGDCGSVDAYFYCWHSQ